MPSIRKRLKKLKFSKKSKSTGDLDQAHLEQHGDGPNSSTSYMDDDSSSQISEAISADVSSATKESSYSVVEGEEKKKKKRRLRLTFPRRKKKEKLVQDSSGNIVFRTMSIDRDPRGNPNHQSTPDVFNSFPEEDNIRKSEGLSKSVDNCLNISEDNQVDGWRMSGLLENVDRKSNSTHDLSSRKDNLIEAFEERRKQHLVNEPAHSSTPLKNDEHVIVEKDDKPEGEANEGDTKALQRPLSIEISSKKRSQDIKEEKPSVPVANGHGTKKKVLPTKTKHHPKGPPKGPPRVIEEDDDWVVIGYSKIGGQVTNLFDESTEEI
eukprot:gene14132-15609_t